MINDGMMSSKSHDWATPQAFYDKLNDEFQFTCDVCAVAWNAKHENYITPEQDALSMPWSGVCFMNPPYGRSIRYWIEKAHQEALKGVLVVALLPARTDTSYFHEFIFEPGYEIRFLKGRIKFEQPDGPLASAPFPSCIVIFKAKSKVRP